MFESAEKDASGIKTISIVVNDAPGAHNYVVELLKGVLSANAVSGRIKIETPAGIIVIPNNMLSGINITDSNVNLRRASKLREPISQCS